MDRDVNSCINIGNKFINKSLEKVIKARTKSKKFTKNKMRRSPASRKSLKYPGRDRTKNRPTNKRTRKSHISNKKQEVTANNQCSTTHNDDVRVIVDGQIKNTLTRTVTSSITKQPTIIGRLD